MTLVKTRAAFETAIKDAVNDLKEAFKNRKLTNTFENEFYYNIKRMNNINLD